MNKERTVKYYVYGNPKMKRIWKFEYPYWYWTVPKAEDPEIKEWHMHGKYMNKMEAAIRGGLIEITETEVFMRYL